MYTPWIFDLIVLSRLGERPVYRSSVHRPFVSSAEGADFWNKAVLLISFFLTWSITRRDQKLTWSQGRTMPQGTVQKFAAACDSLQDSEDVRLPLPKADWKNNAPSSMYWPVPYCSRLSSDPSSPRLLHTLWLFLEVLFSLNLTESPEAFSFCLVYRRL